MFFHILMYCQQNIKFWMNESFKTRSIWCNDAEIVSSQCTQCLNKFTRLHLFTLSSFHFLEKHQNSTIFIVWMFICGFVWSFSERKTLLSNVQLSENGFFSIYRSLIRIISIHFMWLFVNAVVWKHFVIIIINFLPNLLTIPSTESLLNVYLSISVFYTQYLDA